MIKKNDFVSKNEKNVEWFLASFLLYQNILQFTIQWFVSLCLLCAFREDESSPKNSDNKFIAF